MKAASQLSGELELLKLAATATCGVAVRHSVNGADRFAEEQQLASEDGRDC
jgi:hypothetical protein